MRNEEKRAFKLMEIGIAWHENILNIKYIGDNEGEDIGFEDIEFCLLCFLIIFLINRQIFKGHVPRL